MLRNLLDLCTPSQLLFENIYNANFQTIAAIRSTSTYANKNQQR